MEYRPIPGYPGYLVNAAGVVKTDYGYEMTAAKLRLKRRGKQFLVSRADLVALAFPPDGPALQSAPPAPARPSAAAPPKSAEAEIAELKQSLARARKVNKYLLYLNNKYRKQIETAAEAEAEEIAANAGPEEIYL